MLLCGCVSSDIRHPDACFTLFLNCTSCYLSNFCLNTSRKLGVNSYLYWLFRLSKALGFQGLVVMTHISTKRWLIYQYFLFILPSPAILFGRSYNPWKGTAALKNSPQLIYVYIYIYWKAQSLWCINICNIWENLDNFILV